MRALLQVKRLSKNQNFYNNIAGNFKPFDDAYLYNKKFFQFLNLKKHSKLKK